MKVQLTTIILTIVLGSCAIASHNSTSKTHVFSPDYSKTYTIEQVYSKMDSLSKEISADQCNYDSVNIRIQSLEKSTEQFGKAVSQTKRELNSLKKSQVKMDTNLKGKKQEVNQMAEYLKIMEARKK